jgi:signal transduction histidine kinase
VISEGNRLAKEHYALAFEILSLAQRDLQKSQLLDEISNALLGFSGCECVTIYLKESNQYFGSGATGHPFSDTNEALENASLGAAQTVGNGDPPLEQLCHSLLNDQILRQGPHFVSAASFMTGNADQPVNLVRVDDGGQGKRRNISMVLEPSGRFKSIAAITFDLGEDDTGLLLLKSQKREHFSFSTVEFYESLAQLLGVSIVHQRKHLALRERVKELTCLYDIARLLGHPDISLEGILRAAVELLPPAWLYPELTSARIVMDGKTFLSKGYAHGCSQLRSDIAVEGRERGFVEVTYRQEKPEQDEGPFLREERHLLDAVAKELWLIAENYRAAHEGEQLQEQLRHADRLATIGQLSAGVAHELNEPLGGILGFAELSLKHPDLPDQVREDLNKIVSGSLHAREIVRKLMLFARQSPPEKTWVNLNLLVADGLYFVESRCQKSGIELVRELEEDLPEITADPGQIYQVLTNLAVNAIQAMPDGGCLTVCTSRKLAGVLLEVRDTGSGMSDTVKESIFTPFFTTKDVGEGTGLGLSVVEGIVKSHGGSIRVESSPGLGTQFSIYLPSRAPSVGSP